MPGGGCTCGCSPSCSPTWPERPPDARSPALPSWRPTPDEPAGADVVDVPVDRGSIQGRGMRPDPGHVLHDTLALSLDRQPVDVVAFVRSGPATDIVEAVRTQCGRLQAAGEQAAHHVVGEELHAAVGVMDDEPLAGAEELVGDHQRADRVVARPAAGVADDVRVALAQPGVLRRVEPRVHAGEDGELARRWQCQVCLGAERRCVLLVGAQDPAQGRTWDFSLSECGQGGTSGGRLWISAVDDGDWS